MKEVLAAMVKAIDEVDSRHRKPDRARGDKAEERVGGPSRDGGASPESVGGSMEEIIYEGDWGDFPVSEQEEGLRSVRSAPEGGELKLNHPTHSLSCPK